jgi:hypothetical protein
MYWITACPRCGGDLAEGRDINGRYIACLQCGHELTGSEEALVRGGLRLVAAKEPAGLPGRA